MPETTHRSCVHQPPCPGPDAADRSAAVTVSRDSITGWALLCNGVICFDDGGNITPSLIIAPAQRLAA
ncbi:DUF5999 family protein [Streptomyces sp. NPDC006798]|uniref:DUF5999 family protein n=1 Tax=Streptomyces sp. NPDC006798 TaxID=3155462 RepID=UPI0034112314